ncbi:MAG: 30S ribosomal protein S9 [Bacteroidales bacterium]|jgi:small subunit ribosomal protein S9|nr:30S ribosomal protein S9 [Bacteroidales bacterium]MBO7461127.1 30S ribosomal protein S9 [Bacteroidales bacterium]MBO7566942.1 30S ribosomal protein S9 [Bacteroidales bacterium]MBP5682282.1 30S ribosomal protein S9 [Bacteroidales bacterium]MBQ4405528.1 30S ribosomal protein S9 [Bacteroidales bacterium]
MAEYINKVGRRKEAVARVYLTAGTGEFKINGKEIKEYFTVPQFQKVVLQSLEALGAVNNYDVKVNVCGGGFKGQAEAIRMGIARALVEVNPEDRVTLKKEGFLKRDSRVVERKKPGRPGARKRFQFSKR